MLSGVCSGTTTFEKSLPPLSRWPLSSVFRWHGPVSGHGSTRAPSLIESGSLRQAENLK